MTTEQLTPEELSEHMTKIQQDPVAWAFCLACGVSQWIANFGMMSAKRRRLREWILLVQASLLEGLSELQADAAAGKWRQSFAEASRVLGGLQLGDPAIDASIAGLQNQLKTAMEVAL